MRALIQRVREASVDVDASPHASIGRGLLVFLGVQKADTDAQVDALSRKIAGLRLFEDPDGRMNLSLEQVEGEYLVVSQFTLCADLSKGKRPGFDDAMKPPESERLYASFCGKLAALTGRPVKTGVFGASMLVKLANDGPATFWVDVGSSAGPAIQ